MTTAQLADGTQLQFPDETDPDVIQRTVKQYIAKNPQPLSPETEAKRGMFGGIPEAAVALGSSALAGPVSGWAGLGTAAYGYLGNKLGLLNPEETPNPADVVNKVQDALTYQPQSRAGKALVGAASFLPGQLARGADWLGGQATDITGSPAIGAGVNAATQALPFAMLPKIPSAAGDALASGARTMMTKALQSKGTDLAKQNALADTMLQNRLTVSPSSLDNLWDKISDIGEQGKDIIANSPAQIDKNAVADRLLPQNFGGTSLDVFKKQPNNAADLAQIEGVRQGFLNNEFLPSSTPEQTIQSPILNEKGQPFSTTVPASGSDMIPIQQAQEMKQAGYQVLKDRAYGQLGSAEREGTKNLLRSLNTEITDAEPAMAGINAAQAPLLALSDPLEAAVVRGAKNQPIYGASFRERMVPFVLGKSPWFNSVVANALDSAGRGVGGMGSSIPYTSALQPGMDAQARQQQLSKLLRGSQ